MKRYAWRVVCAFLGLMAALPAACAEQKPAPITDKQIEELARRMEKAIHDGQGKVFDGLFEFEVFRARVLNRFDVDAGFKRDFGAGMTKAMQFGPKIAASIKSPREFKFLRLRTREGESRALFRLEQDGGGLNYHEYLIRASPNQGPRIHDVYVYALGEMLSDSMARMALPAVLMHKQKLKLLSPEDRDVLGNLEKMTAMGTATQAGKGQEALDLYAGLPASMKLEKTMMVLRVSAASNVSPEAHAQALEDFAKTHPGDPAQELMSLDLYFFRKDYDKLFVLLDSLEKRVGGDSPLTLLRANVLALSGREDEARKLVLEVLAIDPDNDSAYWTLILASAKKGRFDEMVQWLEKLESRFGRMEFNLEENEHYAAFLKSEAYRAWQKKRLEAPQPAPKPESPKE